MCVCVCICVCVCYCVCVYLSLRVLTCTCGTHSLRCNWALIGLNTQWKISWNTGNKHHQWWCYCKFSSSVVLNCFKTNTDLFLLLLQEVLLKRAADLVEALYGMPHNNQVSYTPDGLVTPTVPRTLQPGLAGLTVPRTLQPGLAGITVPRTLQPGLAGITVPRTLQPGLAGITVPITARFRWYYSTQNFTARISRYYST